jgi:hypothetical protein
VLLMQFACGMTTATVLDGFHRLLKADVIG